MYLINKIYLILIFSIDRDSCVLLWSILLWKFHVQYHAQYNYKKITSIAWMKYLRNDCLNIFY